MITVTPAFSRRAAFSTLGGLVYEYACHEGNYALPGILAGARVQEEDARKAAASAPAKAGSQP
jgi:hypothetical protein